MKKGHRIISNKQFNISIKQFDNKYESNFILNLQNRKKGENRLMKKLRIF